MGTLDIFAADSQSQFQYWRPQNALASLVYLSLLTLANFQLGLMTLAIFKTGYGGVLRWGPAMEARSSWRLIKRC